MRRDSTVPRQRHTLLLGRALRLVWRSGPGWTVASVLLLTVQGILPLLTLYFMKLVIDAIAAGLTAPDKGEVFWQAALWIGLMGAVALLGVLLSSLADIVGETQGQMVADSMYGVLHTKSIEVDLGYYEDPRYYDTLHRAQQEAPFRPTRIVNDMVAVGQSGISLLAMAGLLVSFHWAVAAVLFAAVLPGILIRIKYAGRLFSWQREWTPAERQAQYINWILTGDTHAKEVRIFGLASLLMSRFRELRKTLRRERLAIASRRSAAEFAAQAGGTLAVFGSLGFIALRAVQGSITLGDLVMYYQAFQRGIGFLRQMLSSLADLYEDNLFLSNLFEFLDLRPNVIDPPRPEPIPQRMKTGIVFDQVSFKYPTGTSTVLKEVNLTMRPGEVVALVGENGSGKTTLVKLLCRLYDPTSGVITLDGIDLRRFKVEELRREFSIIFQDYAQYHLSARENIWFGDVALAPGDQRVVAASEISGADDFIKGLPRGYETMLGKWFEDGEELSIGEWQKVALARAFLRDSQFIVLDEPTSALDARAEYEVFKRFRQLAKGRNAIIISQRFSTVRMADRIYVLDRGTIIESGTHEELVQGGGIYASLFDKQAEYYK
ncbi:MAG: ABC transporter ATP-binding protein [Deltaproteobacteria bacterium]|nr:MAG: ABC transporter ATP-binding protein [Deltaproteobacteria bacterium]